MKQGITYKYEVGNGPNDWASNSCVFISHGEAESAAKELLSRWFGVSEYRIVESGQPGNYQLANYRFNNETGKPERISD